MLHFTGFFITFKCSLLVKRALLNAAFAMTIRDFDFTSISSIICSEATQLVEICRIVQLCVTSIICTDIGCRGFSLLQFFPQSFPLRAYCLRAHTHTHSFQWILVALSHSGTVYLHLVKRLGIGGSSSPIHAIKVCELIKLFDVS